MSQQTPVLLVDGDVVGAHVPPAHVPQAVELPVLVAVSAVPLPIFVVPLVLEPRADAVALRSIFLGDIFEVGRGREGGGKQTTDYNTMYLPYSRGRGGHRGGTSLPGSNLDSYLVGVFKGGKGLEI